MSWPPSSARVDNLVRRSLAGSLDAADPSPEDFARAREAFYRHYHLVNGERAQVYPGVIEGLKHMREQGLKLAVVTNKPTEFTLPLLQRTGLAGFSTRWCAATPARAASPTPTRCCTPANCWA